RRSSDLDPSSGGPLRVRSGNPVSGLVVAERLDQLIDFHAVHRTDEAVADEHDDRAHNRGCDGQSLLGRRAQFGDWPGEDVLVDCENDRPTVHEVIAAAEPERRKAGRRPSSIGIAIGPTRAPNQAMSSPSTPPKLSAVSAMAIDRTINKNVVSRAMYSSFRS